MKEKLRIIHTADIHIGTPFTGAGLKPDKIRERRADLLDVTQRICQLVREHRADILLVAGDLFEEDYVSNTEIVRAFNFFRDLAPVPVVISPGNHDPFRTSSPYSLEELPENVFVFKNEKIERLTLNELKLDVFGYGFNANHNYTQPWQGFRITENSNKHRNVILTHGAAFKNNTGHAGSYGPVEIKDLENCGADYVALGHYHKKSIIVTDPFSRSVRAAYPGSPESLKAGDAVDHIVLQIDIDYGTGQAEVEEIITGKRKSLTCKIDVSGINKLSELDTTILKVLTSPESRDNLVDIILTGKLCPELVIDKNEYENNVIGPFSVRIKDKTLPDYDLEAFASEETARGVFCKDMLERINSEPDRKQEFERALHLGLAAFNGIKVEDFPI